MQVDLLEQEEARHPEYSAMAAQEAQGSDSKAWEAVDQVVQVLEGYQESCDPIASRRKGDADRWVSRWRLGARW